MYIPGILYRLGWNQRILTQDHFEDACTARGLVLLDLYLPVAGAYGLLHGQEVIALDRRLTGWRRNLVAWHEFGHALLHTPGHYGHHGKTEMQADIVATVALIPIHLLCRCDGEISETYGYPLSLIRERVRIFQAFKL